MAEQHDAAPPAEPLPPTLAAIADLDDIDQRIIAAMRRNGRIANRELARDVGVNEATVRTRLRRLEDSKTVRVVAMRDLEAMG